MGNPALVDPQFGRGKSQILVQGGFSSVQPARSGNEAESLFLKALEVGRRVQGEEHPETLWRMGKLAALYRDQDRLAEAEPLNVKALAGC